MDFLRNSDFISGPLFATFLLGVTTFILLLWYSKWKQSYWKKIGIPYVKPILFFGSPIDTKQPLHVTDMDRSIKYGRIYGHYEGNSAVLSVAEPNILRNILLKDFNVFSGRRIFKTNDIVEKAVSLLRGEDWKRVRAILSPTFTTGKIKRMMSIFKDCSETLVKNFREASERGEPVEAKSVYGALAMDLIASTAFSTKIDSHGDPNNMFVTAAKQLFAKNATWRAFAIAFFPRIMKLFGANFFPPKVINFFTEKVLQIIAERQRTGQIRNDFLQLLLDIAKEGAEGKKLDQDEKDDIVENYGKVDSNQIFKNYLPKKSLSHEELVAQCVMFLSSGYDTVAGTMAFTSYELALHPDIQEKLIQEVDEALRDNNGELTYEAIQSMKYLDNVIAETMRLYPPAVRLERLAEEDYKLGDTGLIVPKGMIVTIPLYAMHRDPELFPDPDKFDPDRFSPEGRAEQVPYSYMPFGAGPRNCIAMRFALIEIKVCLAYVLSNFRIKKCSETKVPLDFYFGMGLMQAKNVSLFMEIRKDLVKTL